MAKNLEELVGHWKDSRFLFKRKAGKIICKYGPEMNNLSLKNPIKSWMFLWTWDKIGNFLPGKIQRELNEVLSVDDNRYFKTGVGYNVLKNTAKVAGIYLLKNYAPDEITNLCPHFDSAYLQWLTTSCKFLTENFYDSSLKIGVYGLTLHTSVSIANLGTRTFWYNHGGKILKKSGKLSENENSEAKRPTAQWTSELGYWGIYRGGKFLWNKIRNYVKREYGIGNGNHPNNSSEK